MFAYIHIFGHGLHEWAGGRWHVGGLWGVWKGGDVPPGRLFGRWLQDIGLGRETFAHRGADCVGAAGARGRVPAAKAGGLKERSPSGLGTSHATLSAHVGPLSTTGSHIDFPL